MTTQKDIDAEFEAMYLRMQSPESRKAVDELFGATDEKINRVVREDDIEMFDANEQRYLDMEEDD